MTRFPPLVSRLIPNLGRDNDNEILATVRAIDAALRGAKLDWFDLAQACITSETEGDVETSPSRYSDARRRGGCFGDLARAARDLDRKRLTPRERAFIADMCSKGFSYRPSPRQTDWLDDILQRLRGRAAA